MNVICHDCQSFINGEFCTWFMGGAKKASAAQMEKKQEADKSKEQPGKKDKKDKKEKGEEIITAVYKVHLHCRKCACDIKKPLLRFQG